MENPPSMKMYVLLKIGMCSNVMLIFRGVSKMDLLNEVLWFYKVGPKKTVTSRVKKLHL